MKIALPLVDVGSGGIGGRTFFDARGFGGVSHGNSGTGGLNKRLGTSTPKNHFSFFAFFFFQVSGVGTFIVGSLDIEHFEFLKPVLRLPPKKVLQ